MNTTLRAAAALVATLAGVLATTAVTLHLSGIGELLARFTGVSLVGWLGALAVIGVLGGVLWPRLAPGLARRALDAQPLQRPTSDIEAWLLDAVRTAAARARVPTPDVALYRHVDPNALTVGSGRDRALLIVSTGLLDRLSRREIEAVLAHELAHVARGDLTVLAVAQGVLNALVLSPARGIGTVVDRVLLRHRHGAGLGYFFVTLAAEIFFGLLGCLVVLALSRRREFRADADAVAQVGAAAVAAAWRRLDAAEADPLPTEYSGFAIAGLDADGLRGLFVTHPTFERRLAALGPAQSRRDTSGSTLAYGGGA